MEQREILAKRSNKVVYREGNLVYKVFDHSFPKADILNEALNQARIEETGLPIPGIVSVNVTEQGEWTIVQEYISGKTMAQLMKEEPENRNQYLEQFVDLQLLVHSKRSPLLNKLREKLDRQISTCEALSPNTRFIIRGRLDSMPSTLAYFTGILTREILLSVKTERVTSWTGLMRRREMPPPTQRIHICC